MKDDAGFARHSAGRKSGRGRQPLPLIGEPLKDQD